MLEKAKTCVVTIRVDLRDAAQFYQFLQQEKIRINSLSHLFSESFGLLNEVIAHKYNIPRGSTSEAIAYLQANRLFGDLKAQRNYSTIAKQLAEEDGTTQELSSAINNKPIPPDKETLAERIARIQRKVPILTREVPANMLKEESDD